MGLPTIVISGATIANDEALVRELQKSARVLRNEDSGNLNALITQTSVQLLILELPEEGRKEMEMISQLKQQHPHLQIVVINGNGNSEALADAFGCGVEDAFRRPYRVGLVEERVREMIKKE